MDKEKILIKLADLVYKDNWKIHTEGRIRLGLATYIREYKDVKVIWAKSKENIYIAVRGSVPTFRSWLRNLNCLKRKTRFGKIHRGFWNAAKKADKAIQELPRHYKLHFTGHSQGGAVAFIMALMAEERGQQVQMVRTFAQPAVSSDLKYEYEFDYEKYFNNMDAIFRMPPTWSGYDNPLEEATYITQGGELIHNPEPGFVFKDRAKTLFKNKNPLEFIADHSMDLYKLYLL